MIPLPSLNSVGSNTPEDTSIQSILSREILKITKGEGLKFSWIGSEDEESLVSGSGRPFFVQVRNPKTIRLNERRLNFPRYGLFVNIERYFKKLPGQPVQFIAKTRIVIRSSRQLGKEDVLKIKSLANSIVVFPNQKNKSRSSTKRIYSVDVAKIDNRVFEAHLVAEGGLAIKQFVEGREYISPNVSTLPISSVNAYFLIFLMFGLRNTSNIFLTPTHSFISKYGPRSLDKSTRCKRTRINSPEGL